MRGCIDPTTSSAEEFAPTVLAAIADQLRAWPSALNELEGATAGKPPRPGLQLTLRQVVTHAYSTEAPVLAVHVPDISGLPEAPSLDDPKLGAAGTEWNQLDRARRAQVAAAQEAADAAAESIEQWPLLRRTTTAVLDCVAAATTNTTATTRLLVASDFFDNASHAANSTTTDMHGMGVIVLQSCPAGREDECDSELDTFSHWVTQQRGNVLAAFRAGEAKAAISLWFEEAQ